MLWESLGRLATALASTLVLGAIGARWLASRSSALEPTGVDRRLAGVGIGWSVALLAALAFKGVGQSVQVWGWPDGLGWEQLRPVLLESRWAARFRWQPAAVLLVLAGFLLVLWRPRPGWALTTAGGLALAATLPMTGHAWGDPLHWGVQALHVLTVGTWLGTLAVVLLLLGPGHDRRRWLEAFAPLAAPSAALVLLSGAVLAVLSLPSWSSLWQSGYGRTLAVKGALALGVAALGALNFRALRRPNGKTELPRTVAAECALAAGTLAAAALLSSLPDPM